MKHWTKSDIVQVVIASAVLLALTYYHLLILAFSFTNVCAFYGAAVLVTGVIEVAALFIEEMRKR